MAEKKTCFVIGPIGNPDSETRKWADSLLKYVITPATSEHNYNPPVRADEICLTGLITMQIIGHLISADLVIADLTWVNPNVYYELAIRHASRKPVVNLMREGESLPFDNKDVRTITFPDSLGGSQQAVEQLTRFIPEVEKADAAQLNPITAAIDIDLMKHSNDQQQRTLGDLLSQMQELSSGLNIVQSQIISLQTNTPKRTSFPMSWATGVDYRTPNANFVFGSDFETKPTTLEDIAEQVQQINSLLTDLKTSQDSTNDKSN